MLFLELRANSTGQKAYKITSVCAFGSPALALSSSSSKSTSGSSFMASKWIWERKQFVSRIWSFLNHYYIWLKNYRILSTKSNTGVFTRTAEQQWKLTNIFSPPQRRHHYLLFGTCHRMVHSLQFLTYFQRINLSTEEISLQ